jgi:cytochrome c-type biogenesis protein CcmE
MTRKRRRLIIVSTGLIALGVSAALILSAMSDSLVFFYGPGEVAEHHVPPGRHVRVGGLVEEGSVAKEADGKTVHFKITDGKQDLAVTYVGLLPDLFREGQGVVAEGTVGEDGLRAATVLAKHDERYMPKEVVEALKKSGQWRGDGATGEAAPGAAAAKTN